MSALQLTALTTLNMLGSGIIMLPIKLERIGGIAVVSWLFVSMSVSIIAYAFAKFSKYIRNSDELGSIVDSSFGRFGAFVTLTLYAGSLFLANGAIATSIVAYLCDLLVLNLSPFSDELLIILVLSTATAANFVSPRFSGHLGIIALGSICIPLLYVIVGTPLKFNIELFSQNWNPHEYTTVESIKIALPMMFFSFLGMESAWVNAINAINPKHSSACAVLISTVCVSVIYTLSTAIFSGLIPTGWLLDNETPSFIAFRYFLSSGIGEVLSLLFLAGLWGSLMGWQLTLGRVCQTCAREGFLPSVFNKTSQGGIPRDGLMILLILQGLLIPLLPSTTILERYQWLIDVSAVTNVFPYLVCMASIFAISRIKKTIPLRVRRILKASSGYAIFFLLAYFTLIESQYMKIGAVIVLTAFALYGIISPPGKKILDNPLR